MLDGEATVKRLRRENGRDSYKDLLSVDVDAEGMRVYSPTLVPGLLQRGAYARQVINSSAITRTDEDEEGLSRLRLARQSVLERSPNPLRLWAVIGEAALHHKFPATARGIDGGPQAVVASPVGPGVTALVRTVRGVFVDRVAVPLPRRITPVPVLSPRPAARWPVSSGP
ncbi:Scr1 family TA system antitoxin-like transcriptional regulator [Streptomyces sp. NPDC101206]|uniref:Scr1 family TA system antitoxin-like transcriptional regulator n=1 Tax=Streptomyces sp. NPDC101206 TaxID=3366128 RepID=UPI003804D4B7